MTATDIVAVITAGGVFLTSLAAALTSLRNAWKIKGVSTRVDEVHTQMNSRLESLLDKLDQTTAARNDALLELAATVESLRQEKLKNEPKP